MLSFWGLVGSLWEPLGTHVLLWGSFGGSCGILGTLFGSLGGPVGSILGILWHPFGNFLGTLGVYRICPKGDGAPLGRPDWGSLVILWGFLGNLWEPFVGSLGDRQTERHTDRTRQDQTRLDQRLDQRPEQRPDRQTDQRPEQ